MEEQKLCDLGIVSLSDIRRVSRELRGWFCIRRRFNVLHAIGLALTPLAL